MEPDFNEDVEGEDLDIPEQKKGQVITKEMADSEFEAWAKHLRLDTDVDEMDLEEKSEFLQIKKKFTYSLLNGFTQTEENGDLTLNLIESVAGKSTMVFRRSFKGGTFVVMDRYKDNQNIHKTIAFLAAWVGWDPKALMKLDAIDLWFGMKMVSLFFGA